MAQYSRFASAHWRMAADAIIFNVGIAMSGIPHPMQSPFAMDVPMRNPVYEPGPPLMATASGFFKPAGMNARASSTKTLSSAAWDGPSREIFSNTMSSPIDSAAEHTAVDVSICNIHAIFFCCLSVFYGTNIQKQIHLAYLYCFFPKITYLCIQFNRIMIQSMTGFGKVTAELPSRKVTIEIKSVNSRQMDLFARIAPVYREKEMQIRNELLQSLERGKIDFSIQVETVGKEASTQINRAVVESYFEQINTLAWELRVPLPSDWFQTLLRLPEVIKTDAAELDESEWATVSEAIREAVRQLIAFRVQEGAMLQVLFEEKIARIAGLLTQIDDFENERIERIKSRLAESLNRIPEIEYDRNRFEQELIYYLEKLDVNEEKTRLDNHLKYFLETLNDKKGQGKKLGFIVQEIGREINTLGSKSNHAGMQQIVVQMKDELEQIKEQILNVL
jgi:uncharacterized protein (TIGR00255 family)